MAQPDADVVYAGRPMHRRGWQLGGSPLASPFRPGRDGTREEVPEQYREHLLGHPVLLASPSCPGSAAAGWVAGASPSPATHR